MPDIIVWIALSAVTIEAYRLKQRSVMFYKKSVNWEAFI